MSNRDRKLEQRKLAGMLKPPSCGGTPCPWKTVQGHAAVKALLASEPPRRHRCPHAVEALAAMYPFLIKQRARA